MSKSLNCFYFQHSVLFWKKEISFVLLDGLYPNCLPEHSLHCRPFSAHSFFPPPPHFSSLSLSSTVPKLSPLTCLIPNHQVRSSPAFAKLIVPVSRAKHLPFRYKHSFCAELQPVNSVRLGDLPIVPAIEGVSHSSYLRWSCSLDFFIFTEFCHRIFLPFSD